MNISSKVAPHRARHWVIVILDFGDLYGVIEFKTSAAIDFSYDEEGEFRSNFLRVISTSNSTLKV